MSGSLLDFTLRVVSGFNRSQGLLLSGAVAYYTLLSIVPLFLGGHVLLLTALYMGLPVGQVRFTHALIGGVTATVLWEPLCCSRWRQPPSSCSSAPR